MNEPQKTVLIFTSTNSDPSPQAVASMLSQHGYSGQTMPLGDGNNDTNTLVAARNYVRDVTQRGMEFSAVVMMHLRDFAAQDMRPWIEDIQKYAKVIVCERKDFLGQATLQEFRRKEIAVVDSAELDASEQIVEAVAPAKKPAVQPRPRSW